MTTWAVSWVAIDCIFSLISCVIVVWLLRNATRLAEAKSIVLNIGTLVMRRNRLRLESLSEITGSESAELARSIQRTDIELSVALMGARDFAREEE